MQTSDSDFTPAAAAPVTDEHRGVPWGIAVGIGSVALAFAIYFVGALMLGVAIHDLDPGGFHHRFIEYTMLIYQFLTFGVMTSAAVFVLGRYMLGPASLGYWFPGWSRIGGAAIAWIPITFAAALLGAVLNRVLPGSPIHGNAQALFPKYAMHIVPWEFILVALFVAVEVPLTEETLFRGILYQGSRTFFCRWLPYRGAVALAALLSGTVFGIAHLLGDLQDLHTLPMLVFLGVVLAYVFEWGRSVYASATVHGLTNGLALAAVIASLH